MKIESSNYTPATLQNSAMRSTSNADATGAVGAVQGASATGAAGSPVTLSSVSAVRAPSGSDMDMAKVESIKAALRDGSYKIDSGAVADGMLGNANDMLQTQAA